MIDLFGTSDTLSDLAYRKSNDNRDEIRILETRLEKLEEYLGIEWAESNRKYYKVAASNQSEKESKT